MIQLCSPFLYNIKIIFQIRNTIIELWKTNKPCYVSKTLAKQKLKKYGTAKEIGQVHTYLEHRGYVNFGCGNFLKL